MGTPPALDRSGIGKTEILVRANVPLIAHALGVGYEYDDDTLLICPYRSSLAPEETLDSITSGRRKPEELIRMGTKFQGESSGHYL
jgi:alcohol oxidase